MRGNPRRPEGSSVPGLMDEARYAVPTLPSFHVPRPRLVEQFDRSELGLVVLVSAPAGTGKTAAVAEWVRSTGTDGVGWVSFENDDVKFWAHVLPCLSRLGVDVPEQWQPAGDAGLGRDRVLALSGAVGAMPLRLTLVLDGYELESRELGDELDLLVRHARGRLRIVFAGRVDPVFPFYRHAIADALDEVRAADLAFTDAEAAELLQAAGLSLGRGAVHELNERLQGWAAGLRLTARALTGRPDPEGLLSNVVLRTAALTEFLIEEVLNRQPAELRRIVLETSVPDVLCPGLVEEIAGRAAPRAFDSYAELRSLVEPESDHPGWFRYPPFVRDLLRAQLAYEAPERVAEVHRASARWLWGEGLEVEALAHLSKASAWGELASSVVEGLLVGRLLVGGPDGPLAVLARGVPPDLPDPAAAVVRAAVALVTGDEGRSVSELAGARSAQQDPDPRAQALGLSLVVVEASAASRAEDAQTAARVVAAAEQCLDERLLRIAPEVADELVAVVQLAKGVAELRNGNLSAAGEALARVAEREPVDAAATFRAERAGRLALVEALKGNLTRAVQSSADALAFLDVGGVPPAEVPPAAHIALALVGVDRAELDLAHTHVQAAHDSALLPGDATCRALAAAAEAALERDAGDLGAALARLEEAAESAAARDPWLADHLLAEAAAMMLADGQPEAALATLERAHDGDRPEVAVLAAAAYEEQGASLAVDGLLTAAHGDDLPLGTRVRGLLVETVHRSRQRSPGRARQTLDKALYAARAERLRRPFRDASPSVRRWLDADPHFAHGSAWLELSDRGPVPAAGDRDGMALVESLTAKELEILELLAALLTTDEIAEKLFVSVNTVRTHIRSILRKLGVGRRNAAIRRARELGIIDG